MISRAQFIKASAAAVTVAAATSLGAGTSAAMVNVLLPELFCAPVDRGYALALARHLVRWLNEAGCAASLNKNFTSAPVTILVLAKNIPPAWSASIDRYIQRGGRLVCFGCEAPRLASLLGVKIVSRGGTQYTALTSATLKVTQNTSTALRLQVLDAKVIAKWNDGTPAATTNRAGYFVGAVFPADGDERAKQQFLLSMVAPKLQTAFLARLTAADAQARALAQQAGHGAKNEIKAVWDHSGCGLYPGEWNRTMAELKASGITDVYVNVAGAGFAHYPSRIAPASVTYNRYGDQLAAACEAARWNGIRCHAWVLCFTAARSSAATLADFAARSWRLANTEYLDPSHPEVQRRVLALLAEVAAYPVAGVHLDFIRWYEKRQAAEATPGAIKRFRATGRPAGVDSFNAWRAAVIEDFVRRARDEVKRLKPRALVTAAVLGKYPSCVAAVGQDWFRWLDSGFIDYAVPMNYSAVLAKYNDFVSVQGSSPRRAARIISGLGVTANESRLTPHDVIDQIKLARARSLNGIAFFDLDYYLMHNILPLIKPML